MVLTSNTGFPLTDKSICFITVTYADRVELFIVVVYTHTLVVVMHLGLVGSIVRQICGPLYLLGCVIIRGVGCNVFIRCLYP